MTKPSIQVPFFGLEIPLYVFNYTGQIFPPLFAAALLAPLERFLKKVIPTMLHMVFVPMISVMILVPLTAFVVGPIGIRFALGISDVIGNVNEVAPWLVGGLIAGLYLFMVPLGLHWPLNAVMINNLQTMGTDFIQSPMGAYNFAVFGLVTGVAIRAKHNKELRQTATGAAASLPAPRHAGNRPDAATAPIRPGPHAPARLMRSPPRHRDTRAPFLIRRPAAGTPVAQGRRFRQRPTAGRPARRRLRRHAP